MNRTAQLLLAWLSIILGMTFAMVTPASAAAVPTAPRSLVGVSSGTAGAVTLSWTASANSGSSPIDKYVYRVSTNKGATYSAFISFATNPTALTHTVTCATHSNGSGCLYKVFAHNATGYSPASNVVTTWVLPAAPTSLTGTPSANGSTVALSWHAASNFGSFASVTYAVLYSQDNAAFTSLGAPTSVLTFDATCGGTSSCRYEVQTVNGQGKSAPSNVYVYNFTAGAATGLKVINQGSNLATGTSTLKVSWAKVSTPLVTGYQLQSCAFPVESSISCGSASVPWSPNGSVVQSATPNYVHAFPGDGFATYYFRVRSVNSKGGLSPWTTTFVNPWAPYELAAQSTPNGMVNVFVDGPTESGNGTTKFYTVFSCPTNCGVATNWSAGPTRNYPPPPGGFFVGEINCGANVNCQIQAQFTDGTGAKSLLTPTIIGTGGQISLTAPADGTSTNDATPTFSGTCTTGQGNLTLSSSPGGNSSGTIPCTSGTWSFTPSGPIADGIYAVKVTQAASAMVSNMNSFTIDTINPVVTIASPVDGHAFDSGDTVTVSGTCESASGDVTVTLDPGAASTVACTGDAFTIDYLALADGSYTVRASQTDAAANEGTSATISFTVNAVL